ncbi:MAG TPA: hypothetical protein VF781_01060 [Solirubrobacteraceae bacterium]
MIGVETFRQRDLLRVPAVPRARLIAADQHDSVLIGIEGEQQAYTTIHARLLQLVDAGAVNDIDVRTT